MCGPRHHPCGIYIRPPPSITIEYENGFGKFRLGPAGLLASSRLTGSVALPRLGHANLIGHAEFAPGHLAWLLVDENGKLVSGTGVLQAIKRAKDLGLPDDDSGARCLVLPDTQFQPGGIGAKTCRTHRIGRW
jgi:hypothetical protein